MSRALIVAFSAATLIAGCNRGPATPEQTVQQLMANEVQPTAEVYWDSVQFISDETGAHEIRPETDQDWERTRNAATRLGELGELLKTPGYAEGRQEDWTTFSNSLIEVSKLAERAAEAKDPDKVFEIGGTIYNVCTACHQVYPATEGVEDEQEERPGDPEYDAPASVAQEPAT